MPENRKLVALVLALLTATPAFSLTYFQTAELCDAAAQRAAMSEDVPVNILRAITRVETGRRTDGHLKPWPWAVNLEGKEY